MHTIWHIWFGSVKHLSDTFGKGVILMSDTKTMGAGRRSTLSQSHCIIKLTLDHKINYFLWFFKIFERLHFVAFDVLVLLREQLKVLLWPTMTLATYNLLFLFPFAFADVGPLTKSVRDIFNTYGSIANVNFLCVKFKFKIYKLRHCEGLESWKQDPTW